MEQKPPPPGASGQAQQGPRQQPAYDTSNGGHFGMFPCFRLRCLGWFWGPGARKGRAVLLVDLWLRDVVEGCG